jgi:alcohol dehydrogenase
MRAVVIHEHGGRDKLVEEYPPRPVAGPKEIVVAVKACALNQLDMFVLRGLPGLPVRLPRIPGSDTAGVVDEVGEGVTTVSVRQRVMLDPTIKLPDGSLGALGEHADGGLAEYIRVPEGNAIPIPDEVSFIEAAALPTAYGTAWRMLVTRGQVQRGEHVLILGASGGVGTGCVQIAKMMGCVVFAAASTEAKLARLKEVGADVLVNYSEHPEFHRYVRGITSGAGVDVVINYTGGDTWVNSLKSLKPGGRLLTCGATAGYDPRTDIRYIWTRELKIIGANGIRREDLSVLLDAVRGGRIKAIVDRVVPLAEVREGFRLLENREVCGKVIITP